MGTIATVIITIILTLLVCLISIFVFYLLDEPDALVCEEGEEEYNVFSEAVKTFGKNAQIIVAIEELSELINELSKCLNDKNKRGLEGITDEMSDVFIMLNQLLIVFNNKKYIMF